MIHFILMFHFSTMKRLGNPCFLNLCFFVFKGNGSSAKHQDRDPYLPLLCHWSLCIPPENIWKSDIFRGCRKIPVTRSRIT